MCGGSGRVGESEAEEIEVVRGKENGVVGGGGLRCEWKGMEVVTRRKNEGAGVGWGGGTSGGNIERRR